MIPLKELIDSMQISTDQAPSSPRDAINETLDLLPAPRLIENASALLKAVADPGRLRILVLLRSRELCVSDLASFLEMSESAVSHQLRILRSERLVSYRKTGRMAYYYLLDNHVVELLDSALEHAKEKS